MVTTTLTSIVDDTETSEVVREIPLPPPNPLLPKSVKIHDQVPGSIIKGIVFREIKDFKHFADQSKDKLGHNLHNVDGAGSESFSRSCAANRHEAFLLAQSGQQQAGRQLIMNDATKKAQDRLQPDSSPSSKREASRPPELVMNNQLASA